MVSNQFVSRLWPRFQKNLGLDVYDDLFQSEGRTLHVATLLNFKDNKPIKVAYGECVQAALLREEVIIGLQLHDNKRIEKKCLVLN